MPFLDKLKNIFSSGGEAKKKSKLKTYYRQDVDPNEVWSIIGELGDGAFGKVYKAKQKLKAVEAALKQVEIKDEVELEEFSVEIEILSQCKHKNIVGLYEAYFHANKLWMLIEFCGGGALDSIMVDLEKPLTEPQIRYVCRQMCEGLDFLHQCFVIHRDLKAGNVLLTSDGQVKLADFGVSAKNTSFRQTRDTFIGTPYWMAPEVILCETIKDDPYTFRADIWSLGITLIEFAEIQPPNHQLHPMRVLIKIQKAAPPTLRIPTKWSVSFRDFITRCLVKDPDARPTMGELLEHDFIKDATSNESIVELLSEVKAEVILEEEDLDDVMDDIISVIIHDDESSSDSPDALFGTDTDLDTDSGDLLIYLRSEENLTTDREEGTDTQDSPVAESCAETHPFISGNKSNESEADSTIQSSSQIDLEPASPPVSEPQQSMTMAPVSDVPDGPALVPGEPGLEKPIVNNTTSSDDVLREEPASVICETSGELLEKSIPQKFPAVADVMKFPAVSDVRVQNASNLDEDVSGNGSETLQAAVIMEPSQSTDEVVPIKSPLEKVPVQSTMETVPISSPVELVPIQSTAEMLPDGLSLSASETVAIKSFVEAVPIQSIAETVPMAPDTDRVPVQSTETVPMVSASDRVPAHSTDMVPVVSSSDTVPAHSIETVPMTPASDTVLAQSTETVTMAPDTDRVPVHSTETVPMVPSTDTVPVQSTETVPMVSSSDTVPDQLTETVPMVPASDKVPDQLTMEAIPNLATVASLPAQSKPEALPNHLSTDESTSNTSLVEVGTSTENQPTVELDSGSEEVTQLQTTIEVAEDESRRDAAFGNEQDFNDQKSVDFDNGLLQKSVKLKSNDETKPSVDLPGSGNSGKDICLHFSQDSHDTGNGLGDIKNYSNQGNEEKVSTGNQERTIEKVDDVSENEKFENKSQFIIEDDKGASGIDARIADGADTDADLIGLHSAIVSKVCADETKSMVKDGLDVDGNVDSKVWRDNQMDVCEDIAMKMVNGRVNNGTSDETIRGRTVSQGLPGSETEDVTKKLDGKLACNFEGKDTNGSRDVISENLALSICDIEISSVKKVETDSADEQPGTSGHEVSSVEAKQRMDDSKVEISNSTDEAGRQEAKESAVLRYKPNKSKVPPGNIAPHGEKIGESGKSKVVDAEMDVPGKKQISADEEELKKQFRTLTKTRKFVINGVVVTSQTSRVVLSGTENKKHQEHQLWKADLRELKRLQMEENRLLQTLDTKAKATLDELAKKQESDMQVLFRSYEAELEALAKQHQRILNKLVSSQNSEYKALQKKVKSEQEKDLKNLHESLKQDTKLWKQGIEMLPKQMRKEAMAIRKEEKDIEYAGKERKFREEQHEKSESTMKRLTDQHQEKIVLLDKQFLQQKHHNLQVNQSRITELEERHMQEKYMASRIQLQEKFILRRQLMMQRNSKEIEQMKRINHESQQKLMQSQALELRKLPKKLKSDTKTRQLMYKESLRISYIGVTPELEKEKIKQFEEKEKYRKKEEILRIENKHKQQLEALGHRNDKQLSELEEMHAEKLKMLSDHQDQKLMDVEKAFESEREMWKSNLESRNQALVEECCKEIAEHDLFYSQDNGHFLRHPSQRSLTGSAKSGSLTGSMKSGSLAGSMKSGSIRGSLVM